MFQIYRSYNIWLKQQKLQVNSVIYSGGVLLDSFFYGKQINGASDVYDFWICKPDSLIKQHNKGPIT